MAVQGRVVQATAPAGPGSQAISTGSLPAGCFSARYLAARKPSSRGLVSTRAAVSFEATPLTASITGTFLAFSSDSRFSIPSRAMPTRTTASAPPATQFSTCEIWLASWA